MKQYNKPEIMLFAGAEESIALQIDAKYISIGNDGGEYIAPKVDDIW